jgi:hypothetical protein
MTIEVVIIIGHCGGLWVSPPRHACVRILQGRYYAWSIRRCVIEQALAWGEALRSRARE